MACLPVSRRSYPAKEQYITEGDLKETEILLRSVKWTESGAVSNYKAWVEQRTKSIETIARLEKKLENLHKACNAAHGVGSAMEIAGGVAMIAGVFLSALGHKNVGEFLTKKVSPATGVAGMATTMSSSMAEVGLTQQTMKEVKMVLERDREYTELLKENIENFKKIDLRVRRVFNCSILSRVFQDVVKLCKEGISMLDVATGETSKLCGVLMRLKLKVLKGGNYSEGIETAIENVYSTLKTISTDPKLRKAVWNICDIIQQSPSTIEIVKMGLKISIQICNIPYTDIVACLLGVGAMKAAANVMATKYLFGTAMIAINVLSVIAAIKEAKEGTSEYSKMLKELNLALTMELNTVRKNYSNLL